MKPCSWCKSEQIEIKRVMFSNGTAHYQRKCFSCGRKDGFERTVADKDFVMPFGMCAGKTLEEIWHSTPMYLNHCAETFSEGTLKNRLISFMESKNNNASF